MEGMSTAPKLTESPDRGTEPIDLVLKCWPLRDEPRRGWIVGAGPMVAAYVVWWVTGDLALAVAGCVALAGAMWRDFLPITYVISANGISQQVRIMRGRSIRRRRIGWSAVGRCEFHSEGVMVTPQRNGAPIDRMRGIFLPYAQRREELSQAIHQYATWAEIVDES